MAVDTPCRTSLETLLSRLAAPLQRLLLVRGALALAFGVLAFPWPGVTPQFTLGLFAGWMFGAGGAAVAGSLRHHHELPGANLVFAYGLAALVTGTSGLLLPVLAMPLLAGVLAAHALVAGVLDLMLAGRWRFSPRPGLGRRRPGIWLALAGSASLAYAAPVLLLPLTDPDLLAALVGAYGAAHGGVLLAQSVART